MLTGTCRGLETQATGIAGEAQASDRRSTLDTDRTRVQHIGSSWCVAWERPGETRGDHASHGGTLDPIMDRRSTLGTGQRPTATRWLVYVAARDSRGVDPQATGILQKTRCEGDDR